MKYVLHIIAKLYIGGAEKVARDIGLYAPEGYENHYVVFTDEIGAYEAELQACGCKVFHIPPPSESYAGFVRNLKKLMREYPYQAVHAHTMFNAGWVMFAAKQMGVPVRVAHAHSALRNGRSLKKDLYEAAMRGMILRCATDLVGCGVDAGNRLFGEKAFAERGKLILNGIDTDKFAFSESMRTEMRAKLGLTDAFVIGHVGHLAEVKNQKYLISLLPGLMKKRENAVLLLLGDGDDRAMLEREAETLGVRERVLFTGNVNNVQDYLCTMDVFAFPSLFEGMPLSIVEVQSNGLPCVLSDRVPEDVYLTGLIHALPLETPAAWIDAVCSAQRAGCEAYALLLREKGFDIRTVADRFYRIYERNNHD